MVELTVPDELAASFNGVLLRPDDAGYDEARRSTTAWSTSVPG